MGRIQLARSPHLLDELQFPCQSLSLNALHSIIDGLQRTEVSAERWKGALSVTFILS